MDPSKGHHPRGWSRRLRAIDWRGWIALAWVVWFGILYGKMVLEERGDKIRAVFSIPRR